MTIINNFEPYFDDYNEHKKFYQILFRPGYSVQARELTQLQTLLQTQIERMGNHLFKDGAMVIPGQISFDTNLKYIKLKDTNLLNDSIITKTVKGNKSGVEALVVQYKKKESLINDSDMIFIKYVKNGTDPSKPNEIGSLSEFLKDESITTIENSIFEQITFEIQTDITNDRYKPFGEASCASLRQGIYYIRGYFVLVEDQTIVLDINSSFPSYRIGLTINISLIEPEDDETLLDNANNSYNYAAPGAHRLAITTNLTKYALNTSDNVIDGTNFIELLRVNKGKIEFILNKTEYSYLTDTLARRTYDESGNYVVRPFELSIKEYRDNYRGEWNYNNIYIKNDIVSINNNGQTEYYYALKDINNADQSTSSPTPITSWQKTNKPLYNNGLFKKDSSTINTLNYIDGVPVTVTKTVTIEDHKQWADQLAIGLSPGKAYVQGYEIEKGMTEYISITKAKDISKDITVSMPLLLGNYINIILNDNILNLPNINALQYINLYNNPYPTSDDIPIGTAKVRSFELSDISAVPQIYKLFIFNIQMKNNYNFVQDVYSVGFTDDNNVNKPIIFSARIFPTLIQLNGMFTQPSGNYDNITKLYTYTLSGSNINFSELEQNDYLYNNTTNTYAKIVSFNSITNQIVLTSKLPFFNITNTASSSTTFLYKTNSTINDIANSSLLYQIPGYAVNTIKSITATYICFSTAQIPTTGTKEVTIPFQYNPTQIDEIIVFVQNGNSITKLSTYNETGFGYSRSINNLNLIITLGDNVIGTTLLVYSKIEQTGFRTKSRELYTTTFKNDADINNTIWELDQVDGIALESVFMENGLNNKIDITNRFIFHNGQTASYYGKAYLTLQDNALPPTSEFTVQYYYYKRSNNSNNIGPFIVNSYSPEYTEIPFFNNIPLRDCIDFRPDITNNLVYLPDPNSNITLTYNTYLGKKYNIGLMSTGEIKAIEGISDINPKTPSSVTNMMDLYNLELEPYTFFASNKSIIVTPINNKRYTMKDINRLEDRINNLEYYTSLSLLELSTNSLRIPDENGLDRFKNGFIVDNFKSQAVGDVYSSDYKCSIDMNNGILRPFFAMNNIEYALDTVDTNAAKLSKDIITLPYTNEEIISQPYASTTENVNPFMIFTFIGQAEITPPFDKWIDVDRSRPNITIYKEGDYSAIAALAVKAGVLGTVYGVWDTHITATTITNSKVVSNVYDTYGVQKGTMSVGNILTNNNDWGNWRDRSTFSAEDLALIGGGGDASAGGRVITNQITAISDGYMSRQNTITSLSEVQSLTVKDDKIVSTSVIPFMRSRTILIQAKYLKPNTQYYPYFDKKLVQPYCIQSSRIKLSNLVGSFNPSINNLSDSDNNARKTMYNSNLALTTGDVIYISKRDNTSYTKDTTILTAIVVGAFKESNNNIIEDYITVVNLKSDVGETKFIPGDIITNGTENNAASARVDEFEYRQANKPLISNNSGSLEYLFDIPNNDQIKFTTGKKELALLTNSDYNTLLSESSLFEEFLAEGFTEYRQQTIESVRNAVLETKHLVETQNLAGTVLSSTTIADTGWYDPLAQTFLVNTDAIISKASTKKSEGCFLTEIKLYFATKDEALPITLQVREVVNGYPGKYILPFSQVSLEPSNIVTSNNGTSETIFKFSSPVYVQNNTEYCFVLLSDSINYNIWTSKLGEVDKITNRIIDKQPYAGVLFKSQNASTWTAEQLQDIKFVISRAKFDIDKTPTINFKPLPLPFVILENNPLHFKAGSTLIRIPIANHGFNKGDSIELKPYIDNTNILWTIDSTPVTNSTQYKNVISTTTTEITRLIKKGASFYDINGKFIGNCSEIALNNLNNINVTLDTTTKITLNRNDCVLYYINPINEIVASNLLTTHIITNAQDPDYIEIDITNNINITNITNILTEISSDYTISNIDLITYSLTKDVTSIIKKDTILFNTKGIAIGTVLYSIYDNSNNTTTVVLTKQTTQTTETPKYYLNINSGSFGNSIVSSKQIVYNTMKTNMGLQLFNNTEYAVKYENTNIPINETFNFQQTKYIKSIKDANITITLNSDIDTLSPVIDTRNISNILIQNKINSPTSSLNTEFDTRYLATFKLNAGNTLKEKRVYDLGLLSWTLDDILNPSIVILVISENILNFGSLYKEQYIRLYLQGSFAEKTIDLLVNSISNTANNTTLIFNYNDIKSFISNKTINTETTTYNEIGLLDGTNLFNIIALDNYYTENIYSGSSSISKYVTRFIQFANPSTYLKIKFIANIPKDSNIQVYYKTQKIGSTNNIYLDEYINTNWTPTSIYYNRYAEAEINLDMLETFTGVIVKIVFNSNDIAITPSIKDLRIIACA